MIRNLGNLGNKAKLDRIFKAFQSAKDNNCGLVIVMDPCCYGKNAECFSPEEVMNLSIAGNKDTLFLIKENIVVREYPWWDLEKVNVLW